MACANTVAVLPVSAITPASLGSSHAVLIWVECRALV